MQAEGLVYRLLLVLMAILPGPALQPSTTD
jgi:hypothetical protein